MLDPISTTTAGPIDPKKIESWKLTAEGIGADNIERRQIFEALQSVWLDARGELIALLREVDRATRAAVPCPICRAPDVAHAPDCRLAAFLRGTP
jgi:hypothetical protein